MLTRSDFFHLCPGRLATQHRLEAKGAEGAEGAEGTGGMRGGVLPDQVLVPYGEDYEGVTDRHHVFRGEDAPRAMAQLAWLLSADMSASGWLSGCAQLRGCQPNPELVVAKTFEKEGLHVVRTPRTMFTVATPGDETRWRHAEKEFPDHPGLLLKYPNEFDLAVASCGAEATAQFLSTRKQLFNSPGELELRARSALARSQLAAGELHNGSMLQRGRAAVPGVTLGPGARAAPRNVAFLKLHKTSGTSTAYDLFRSLQRRADQEGTPFVSLGKEEYAPEVGRRDGPCSLHKVSMLDGCSAHKCRSSGGGGGGADCALLQHNSLPLYQSRGAEGIRACLGPGALTTSVLREPSARTVSAYFYYACGSARTAEQLAAELARPEVLRCALYSMLLPPRLGLGVGVGIGVGVRLVLLGLGLGEG